MSEQFHILYDYQEFRETIKKILLLRCVILVDCETIVITIACTDRSGVKSCLPGLNVGRGKFSSARVSIIVSQGVKQGGKEVVAASDILDVWRHYDDESVHRVPRDKD